jgi:hypothetical protein
MEVLYFFGAIAALLFLINAFSWREQAIEYQKRSSELSTLERRRAEFDKHVAIQEAEIQSRKVSAENETRVRQDALLHLANEKTEGFPYLATAWAEYLSIRDRQVESGLRYKSRPAKTAADTVKLFARERREAVRQTKKTEYLLLFYESLFPWLKEYRQQGIDEAQIRVGTVGWDEKDDPAARWVPTGEWAGLSPAQRNQMALDRYVKRPKSNWEIGRDYERYVGHLHECEGYSVQYVGALEGLDDLGRDLLAEGNGKVRIIQCKLWAEFKQIHEKHIFQLFGTSVEYALRKRFGSKYEREGLFGDLNLLEGISPVLYTSTQLSDRARNFSRALNIEVVESFKLPQYPMIKCNVSREGGRIYHLPFDQQYDRVRIEAHKGERYVSTVAEAERLGFRRAYRWRSGGSA